MDANEVVALIILVVGMPVGVVLVELGFRANDEAEDAELRRIEEDVHSAQIIEEWRKEEA